MAKFSNLREDFVGAIVDTTDFRVYAERSWIYGGVNPGSPAPVNSESGSPGILRIPTSSGNGDSIYIALGGATHGYYLPADVQSFRVRLRPVTLTSCTILAGLGDNINNSTFGSNGLFFEYDAATNGNIRSVSRLGGTSTETDTTLTMGTSFVTLDFIQAAAGRWYTYATDSAGRRFCTTHTANVPTTPLTFGIRIQTLTAAVRSCEIDLIEVDSVPLPLR